MGDDPSAHIRLAREEDAGRLAVLCCQLGYGATEAQVRERLLGDMMQGDTYVVYVADLPDMPVAGWVQVFVCQMLMLDRHAELAGLVVDESRRGRGIGRLLMQTAERWAREKGCTRVRVRSNVIREGAHRFYQAIGYEMAKTQLTFQKIL
jgi:GNAT superfamily N-acetyltransferase